MAERIGFNQITDIITIAGCSNDPRAQALTRELDELRKQSRFQLCVDFRYDVSMAIQKHFPKGTENEPEDSILFKILKKM